MCSGASVDMHRVNTVQAIFTAECSTYLMRGIWLCQLDVGSITGQPLFIYKEPAEVQH